MRTRLQHHPMNKQVDLHPSPAAVHYYGGHKNAMAQLDELSHWFLLESLFGYRHQGDGCLQIVPPAVSRDIHSASHTDTATSSTESSFASAPPGLALPLHKARLLPRTPRHNQSPALLLSAQQAAIASGQREAHSTLYKGSTFVNPGTHISVHVFGPSATIIEPPIDRELWTCHDPLVHPYLTNLHDGEWVPLLTTCRKQIHSAIEPQSLYPDPVAALDPRVLTIVCAGMGSHP